MSFLACSALSRSLSSLTHCLIFFLIAGSDDLEDSWSDVNDLASRKRVSASHTVDVFLDHSLSLANLLSSIELTVESPWSRIEE